MKQLSIFTKNSEPIKKTHWTLFIDGAARGNPGLAGAGIYLLKNNKVAAKNSYFLGTKTNNQAEYLALLYGLQTSKDHGFQNNDHLTIYSDSELLVRQFKGIYKIKNQELKKLYDNAIDLLLDVDYKIEHIRREKNYIADELANIAIDKRKTA